jgi:hypothetical protein
MAGMYLGSYLPRPLLMEPAPDGRGIQDMWVGCGWPLAGCHFLLAGKAVGRPPETQRPCSNGRKGNMGMTGWQNPALLHGLLPSTLKPDSPIFQ